jgi:hypothetical protein
MTVTRFRWLAALGCTTLLGAGALAHIQTPARAEAPGNPAAPTLTWQLPPDVANGLNASQEDYDVLSWQQFIALNWPAAAGQRGVPDTTRTLGDGLGGPAVWETWKEPYEVFLPTGTLPPPQNQWNTPMQPIHGCSSRTGRVLTQNAKVSDQLDDLNEAGFTQQAPTAPLIDRAGYYARYEVRINEAEFDWIVAHRYYDASVQRAAVQDDTFVDPPGTGAGDTTYTTSSMEIKAGWRRMDSVPADARNRYYTTEAMVYDPDAGTCTGPVLVGLVGFHVLRLTPSAHMWVWSSFEQVDNLSVAAGAPADMTPAFNPTGSTTYPNGYSYRPAKLTPTNPPRPEPTDSPVGVSRRAPILTTPGLNAQYQAALPAPWKYYRLVGTQNPKIVRGGPNGKGLPANASVFTNPVMETFTQRGSCTGCHQKATPIGGRIPKEQIFIFVLQRAASSSTGQRR